jgi:hypothetical protein
MSHPARAAIEEWLPIFPNKITDITIMTGEITSEPLKIVGAVPMMMAGGIQSA